MSKRLPVELRDAIEACQQFDPPLGSYVVDEAGKILYANDEFEKVLGPWKNGRDMRSFYVDGRQRDFLDQRNADVLKAVTLHLKRADGEDCFVKDFSRSIYDTTGNKIGMKCCFLEITEEERASQILKTIPAGIYQLSRDDELIFGNQQLAEMHGFQDFSSIAGKKASDFYFDLRDGHLLERRIRSEGFVTNEKIQLVGPGGRPIWGSITATRLNDSRGRYAGREGVIIDVTREEDYRQLIEELPIGLFRVRCQESGEELLDHYNPMFARITGYDETELLDQPISRIHQDDEAFQEKLGRLHKDPSVEYLGPHTVRIKRRDGEHSFVEVTTKIIRDRQGRPIHRVGAGHDVTDKVELRKWERLIREDFGNFLHTLTSNLMALRHTLDIARSPCGKDPFDDPSTSTLGQDILKIDAAARALADVLDELIQLYDDDRTRQVLPAEDWTALKSSRSFLRSESSELTAGVRHAALGEVGLQILNSLENWVGGHVRRDLEKRAKTKARQLANISILLSLHLASSRMVEMDSEVQRLREIVLTSEVGDIDRKSKELGDIIRLVLADLSDYARRQRVDLRATFSPELERAKVLIEVPSVRRALGNLVHNAIKYSWHSPDGVFAKLRLIRQGDLVGVEIQSFGVPVAEDEHDKVFEVGFRGRFSGDRRRRGTGVGLWDARRVARRHGGNVELFSRPASGPEGDYSRPYLTTVNFLVESS